MKYMILISLLAILGGCQEYRNNQFKMICFEQVLPALCTDMVGCELAPNMQVCDVHMRSMCLTPAQSATTEDLVICAQALREMSCTDGLPTECLKLK